MNANEGVNREAQRAEAQHVDDDSAGYVYATRMPTGNIKVGMGRNAKRAEAGKTFGPIEVLKIWKVADRRVAEKLARSVIAHLRVGKRELFKSTGEQIVALIDRVLASPAAKMSSEDDVWFENDPRSCNFEPSAEAWAVVEAQAAAAKAARDAVAKKSAAANIKGWLR